MWYKFTEMWNSGHGEVRYWWCSTKAEAEEIALGFEQDVDDGYAFRRIIIEAVNFPPKSWLMKQLREIEIKQTNLRMYKRQIQGALADA